MSKKLRIGIIGLGGAGRAHASRLNRNPYVEKVFGYDIKKIDDVENITIVKSREELFANVDAVTICTPDQAHFEGIVASLKAGKHVLVEKPMVANSLEVSKLKPYIKKYSNLVFGVHHQMRCNPAFWKARDLIKRGRLGKLFYIESNYWHDMRMRADKFDNWRQKYGQSLIFGHECHPLDLLMFLTNSEPIKHTTFVSKNSFNKYNTPYTSATTMLQFPNNLIGKIHVNSSCTFPQVYDLVIAGDKGTYIDGVLYTGKEGFRQIAGFFGDKDWLHTEMIITKLGIPKKILSVLINAYMRSVNYLINIYMRLGSFLSLKIMREADFGFRRFPLTAYNHDFACQYIINNFISSILGKEKVVANFEQAGKVIKLCEELEKDGLSKMRFIKN